MCREPRNQMPDPSNRICTEVATFPNSPIPVLLASVVYPLNASVLHQNPPSKNLQPKDLSFVLLFKPQGLFIPKP